YEAQEPRMVSASVVSVAAAAPDMAAAASDVVGQIASGPGSAVAAAAVLAGLSLEPATECAPTEVVERALQERWPLLHLPSEHLDVVPDPVLAQMKAYVHAGGTVYVDRLEPARQERLADVCRSLGVPAPTARWAPATSSLNF